MFLSFMSYCAILLTVLVAFDSDSTATRIFLILNEEISSWDISWWKIIIINEKNLIQYHLLHLLHKKRGRFTKEAESRILIRSKRIYVGSCSCLILSCSFRWYLSRYLFLNVLEHISHEKQGVLSSCVERCWASLDGSANLEVKGIFWNRRKVKKNFATFLCRSDTHKPCDSDSVRDISIDIYTWSFCHIRSMCKSCRCA